jgi:hypothetical protein
VKKRDFQVRNLTLAEEPAEEVKVQKTILYQAVPNTSGQPNCQIIININNNKKVIKIVCNELNKMI